MIDERALTDPTVCPSCGSQLSGRPVCGTCRVDLSGPAGVRMWDLSVQLAQLLAERRLLLDQLPRAPRAPAGAPAGAPAAPQPAWTTPARPVPARSVPEWTRRRVQNLLLTLGVGLLAVAAVIFLVVSWSVLGIGGRAAVMVGCTVLAAGGAAVAHRKGLEATAEAVSLLSVGLALLDAWGARHAGLAGLDQVPGLGYWAGALAVVAALAAATAVAVPTRGLRVPAALLALLPVPLLTLRLSDGSGAPQAVLGTGLLVGSLLALGAAAAWPFGPSTRDARLVLAVGGALTSVAAARASLGAAYGEPGQVLVGAALLLALAAVAAAVLLVDRRVAVPASAVATALVVSAVWAPLVDRVADDWQPVALAAAVVALLVVAQVVPRTLRAAPVATLTTALLVPAARTLEPLAVAVAGHLGWLDRAWSVSASGTAADRLDRVPSGLVGEPTSWGAEQPVLLLVLVAAAAVLALLHGQLLGGYRRVAVAAAAPLLAAAALVLPVAAALSFRGALVVEAAAGGVLLTAGALAWRRGQRLVGGAGLAAGAALLGLVSAWAFAAQASTLTVLPVVAVLLVGAAAGCGGTAAVDVPRLPLAVAGALVALGEVGALARAAGAGDSAVAAWVLSVAAVLAVAVALVVPGPVRRGLVVTAVAAVLADAVALALWSGGTAAEAGLVLAVLATVLTAVVLRDDLLPAVRVALPGPLTYDVAVVAVTGAAVGTMLSALDPDQLWLALLATGAGAAVVALRGSWAGLGWLAGGLLTASSWVRLLLSDVHAPEPYTVPAGVALVALGMLRRRREPDYPSWRAYATGLTLALGPSLLRAVTDAGTVRPLLLGLAALLVVGAGIERRLKAPLVVGGAVLAVDALVQLAPSLMALYAAVPRWVVLAAAGLLLLGVGATYEQRAREVQALRHRVSRFG